MPLPFPSVLTPLACACLLASVTCHAQDTSAADMQMQRLVTLSDRNITDVAPVDEKWKLESGRSTSYDAPVLIDSADYGSFVYWSGTGMRLDPNDTGNDWNNLPSNSLSRFGPAIMRVPPTPAKYQKSVVTKELFGSAMARAGLGTQIIERADGTLVAGLLMEARTAMAPWTPDNMYPALANQYGADEFGNTLLKTGALVRADGDGTNARLILSTLNRVYFPYGRLAQASDGTLYGMDEGPDGHGRIYRLSPGDALSTVHVFPAPAVGSGQWLNDIILGSDGWLYGLMGYGRGTPGVPSTRTAPDTPTGIIFKLHPDQAGSFTILREFTLQEGEFNVEHPSIFYTNNSALNASFKMLTPGMNTLAEGPDGRIYGTTSVSACNVYTRFQNWVLRPDTGTNELITASRMTPSQLCGEVEGSRALTSPGGGFPKWTFLNPGNIYDVDFQRNGSIFRLDRDGNGFQVLHRFDGRNGATPRGPFVFKGHTLIGTTLAGGEPHYHYNNEPVSEGWVRNSMPADRSEDDFAHKASDGVLYALDIQAWEQGANDAYRVLHEFNQRTTGRSPSGVSLGRDGAIYGMTRHGGADQWFGNVQGRGVEYSYSDSGTIWRFGLDQGANINLAIFPAAIKRGEIARLTWTATNVVPGSCTATSKAGDWTGPATEEGAIDLVKADSGVYTYSLACVNDVNGQPVGSNPVTLRVDSPASETDGNSIKYTGGGGSLPLWPTLSLLLLAAGRRAGKPH